MLQTTHQFHLPRSHIPLPHLSTRLPVLTTPESIIESTSTQDLLDDLIDESTRIKARRPIILQFDPTGNELWKKWRGTVFSESWRSCLRNMFLASAIGVYFYVHPEMKSKLEGFAVLWAQLLSVTTFTLTFFLNVSYNLWRKCYLVSRRLQGRLNDLGMLLATYATRSSPSPSSNPKETPMSTYTPGSKQVLTLISRYVRLFNLLTYASFTRSHRPILTPRGMRRLVDRGVITKNEREALVEADIPATQRHNAVVLWIMRVFVEGRQAGHLMGGNGFEQNFLQRCHEIRAQYGSIGDELSGRMPLAYAHIVQVLVDVVLWLYPVMSFSSGMGVVLGVLGCGLLTLFYQGLFDLSKQFIDPYDNENYGQGDDPLVVDTLIAESNAGSVRWINAFEFQPWNSEQIVNAETQEYSTSMPLQGYTVADLAEKEAKLQEQKLREANVQNEIEEEIPTDSTSLDADTTIPTIIPTPQPPTTTAPHATSNVEHETPPSQDDDDDEEDDKTLSQNLAEEIENSMLGEDMSSLPQALDEFSKKADAALEEAMEELKETEAILNASPLAEYLDEDDEIKEVDEGMEEEMSEEEIERKILEMDEEELVQSGSLDNPDADSDVSSPVNVKVNPPATTKSSKGKDVIQETMAEATKNVVMATAEKEVIERIEEVVSTSGVLDDDDEADEESLDVDDIEKIMKNAKLDDGNGDNSADGNESGEEYKPLFDKSLGES
ncbi:hypothetical protein TL16_g03304 [Triparma laevis f. inornata]|uniref:Uncharacterized protein n=1 Tax=Triparma laevis f. inornata TaxID=1714386 RepID=A0A9W7A2E5_9STRA|nr:hypothetical protein TL16_g03304 [Triparma laevis f. inornata]